MSNRVSPPGAMIQEVLHGLTSQPKEIPCKFFYDESGSKLFEKICEQKEYYLTRTELHIMGDHLPEMVKSMGRETLLVEYGSGSGQKTKMILGALKNCAGYIPVDISRHALDQFAARLRALYPNLEVKPVCTDFTKSFRLPDVSKSVKHKVIYFPGSTIGNFSPDEAKRFLAGMAALAGRGGGILIGVDLKKSPDILEAAYNDGRGFTKAFNLNVLIRLNKEIGTNFDVRFFDHRAHYNRELGCVEMFLESLSQQKIRLNGSSIGLSRGERIRTERSYKYDLDEFKKLAQSVQLNVHRTWTDKRRLFSVQYLTTDSFRS